MLVFVAYVNTRDDVSWRQCDGEERGKFPTVKDLFIWASIQ